MAKYCIAGRKLSCRYRLSDIYCRKDSFCSFRSDKNPNELKKDAEQTDESITLCGKIKTECVNYDCGFCKSADECDNKRNFMINIGTYDATRHAMSDLVSMLKYKQNGKVER